MFYCTNVSSPVGDLTLASDDTHLVGLWLNGQKYYMHSIPEIPVSKEDGKIFGMAKEWLARYFAGEKPLPQELPLSPIGSEFRKAVWKELMSIPYGETTTYGALAKKIAGRFGKVSMSAQAVGGAVAHNPISIIIPCHRVLGTNGSLTGYAGGIDKKIQLLNLEGVSWITPN